MFRPAHEGTHKVITANRLIDGLVVFVGAGLQWVLNINDAVILGDGPELAGALAFGAEEVAARKIVDPYAIDVSLRDGRPVPDRLRERIRAIGPSVDYGEDERRRLSGTPRLAAAE